MTTQFGPTGVNYFEDRADGGFAWTVAYDLSLKRSVVQVELRVDLVGADPGATAAIWENGAEAIWNQKIFFSDGTRLYELAFDLDFTDTGAHQVVTVYNGAGRDNMTNWYLEQPGWGQDYLDEIVAHEMGHMLGAFDEYAGGATFGGFTRTGTLMADLSISGFEDFVFGIEDNAETFGDTELTTVLATLGSEGADELDGTDGMDGVYGLAGKDTIAGVAGNDFLNGGAGGDLLQGGVGNDDLFGASGNDRLNGGTGIDTVSGGVGRDTFLFNTATGARNIDILQGFVVKDDTIALDNAVFDAFVGKRDLRVGEFRRGSVAVDDDDRILFNASTGALFYDEDGVGGTAAVQFARIAGLTGTLGFEDFIIV